MALILAFVGLLYSLKDDLGSGKAFAGGAVIVGLAGGAVMVGLVGGAVMVGLVGAAVTVGLVGGAVMVGLVGGAVIVGFGGGATATGGIVGGATLALTFFTGGVGGTKGVVLTVFGTTKAAFATGMGGAD